MFDRSHKQPSDRRVGPRARLLLVAAAALAAAGIALGCQATDPSPVGFSVRSSAIVAPNGRRFIVKGAVFPYGTLAGGDAGGAGAANLRQAPATFRRLTALGFNLVRVFTEVQPPSSPRRDVLQRIVREARSSGLVVEISTAGADPAASVPWLRYLARTYRSDPYVWVQPANEPGCTGGPPPAGCLDWSAWQRGQSQLIAAIRSEGMRSPIVLNTPNYSSDLSKVDQYPLHDRNLVYGAHAYANNLTGVGAPERALYTGLWAGLAGRHAVIVDEVGNFNGPSYPNSSGWASEFMAFTRDWVRQGGGSGAIGFTWHWVDPNTMTGDDGALTAWGHTFVDTFIRQVPAS